LVDTFYLSIIFSPLSRSLSLSLSLSENKKSARRLKSQNRNFKRASPEKLFFSFFFFCAPNYATVAEKN